ncbi:hypothetical protein [Sutterella wadsworthensis]|uniref:hypothetical protein n=1 Tax=Sutterella wadsworthensis TaxID=40545 RepID=UPI0013F59F91|nr:hypothetical protein [Sutterella wadsworthensis]
MSPSRPKLYNPKLVCACALLFTPIFGALLQARNWEEMGIPENARASRVWVRSTVWLIVVYLVLQALFRNEEIANWLGPYFLIVLWGSWMLSNGWRQLAFVNQTYGKNYDSLPIGRPMILGAAGWLFYGLISFTMALGLSLAGIEPLNQSAPENGVVIRIPEGSDKPVIEPLPAPDDKNATTAPEHQDTTSPAATHAPAADTTNQSHS